MREFANYPSATPNGQKKVRIITDCQLSTKDKKHYFLLNGNTWCHLGSRQVVARKNRLLDSVGKGEGGMFQENSVKQISSPGWMHETSARTQCTGKNQRDRVEREVGRGIGMGNTCVSMADSCLCMTKTISIL